MSGGDQSLQRTLVPAVGLKVSLLKLDQQDLLQRPVEPTEHRVLGTAGVEEEMLPKHLTDEVPVGLLARTLLVGLNADTHARLLARLLKHMSYIVLNVVKCQLVVITERPQNTLNDIHRSRDGMRREPTPQVISVSRHRQLR